MGGEQLFHEAMVWGRTGQRGIDKGARKTRPQLTEAQKRNTRQKIAETKRLDVGQPRLSFAGNTQARVDAEDEEGSVSYHGYTESQEDMRCGRHALNHVFDGPQISDDDLIQACRVFIAEYQLPDREGGEISRTSESDHLRFKYRCICAILH